MFTIDPYYSIDNYIEGIQALRNNRIDYKEYILAKSPFYWYIDAKDSPIMLNYDKLSKDMQKFIINKVEPANPADEYLLARKTSLSGVKGLRTYTINNALKKAQKSNYACFFEVRNKAQMIELSKSLGTLYYFGKYYNNTKVGLCTNEMIKNYINVSEILVEKQSSVTQMELDLNFKIFRLNDRLRKFTETPSFINGKYKPVKIKQFNVNL